MSEQRADFSTGGFVLHKINVPGFKGCFSAWFASNGSLLDAEQTLTSGERKATAKARTYLARFGAIKRPSYNRPMAAQGLKAYRYAGRYGWVMIGAKDTADALNEARRSINCGTDLAKLQEWDGTQYTEVQS